MSSWTHCLTSSKERSSSRMNGAMYVSKDEKAWAPAHSFCSVPRKLTIWPQAADRCLGGADEIAPGTPLNPSSSRRRSDQPAQ